MLISQSHKTIVPLPTHVVKKAIYIFLGLFMLLNHSSLAQQKTTLTAKEILAKMSASIDNITALKYSLKITERGKKGYNYYESSVKLCKKPRKLYLYIKGIEVLWIQGTNNGKAYVKPNSFPYINLNLDPMGSLMRQDQHHTINEMGFDYLGGIIDYAASKLGDKLEQYITVEGEERYNNRPCYKMTLHNKDFSYTTYTVGVNESITSIARKLYVSEYMILELNPKFNDYFDILKKGQVIIVPNWYAKIVTFYIDQLYFLPVGTKVYDDKGLFEEYNYFFLQVNPKIEDEEFTKNYPGYHF
jgi:outer membrane lipoprotein-sorting protein